MPPLFLPSSHARSGRLSLWVGAVRGGGARAASAGARVQLLGVPHDGLSAHYRSSRAIRVADRPRRARELPLRHGRSRASLLPLLRREEFLPAAVASGLVERKCELSRPAGRACDQDLRWPELGTRGGEPRRAVAARL